MKYLIALILFSATVIIQAATPEKMIFAHYMGCFPAGFGPTEHHRKEMAKTLKHDSKNYLDALGGRVVNWPLVPQDQQLTPDQSAELEIKRAIRGGIDGFSVDAWAGDIGAKQVTDRLFAAAEKMKAPFYITICLDASCLPKNDKEPGNNIQAYADAIKYVLERHGNSPNLARRNGKPLIVGYHSRGIYRPESDKNLPEGPEKWNKISQAYKEVEKLVGQPLFFHFCIDAFFYGVPQQPPEKMIEAAAWAGKNFGAVGGFLGNQWDSQVPAMAKAIKAGGAEYSQPMWFQYNNKAGELMAGNGLDILRHNWDLARQYNSPLIQFVTWNDYGEDTVLAPGYSTGYTVLDINRYFIDFWKNGKAPVPQQDQVHLIFRRFINGAQSFPFAMRRAVPGVLEVVTLLKAPAEIIIPGYDVKYQAPAGMLVKQLPLRVGEVGATVMRKGAKVLEVKAPEIITDKPFREDNSMVCFSSNFDEQWKLDFPQTAPLYYSENGDIDKDGLPNWFEMYWFGKFPDMTSATAAKPEDDPDHDGISNLQEYKNQTNPLKQEAKYQTGDIWDIVNEIPARKVSFNPDADAKGTPVWYYLYKHGEREETPHDGNYTPCPHSGQDVGYAGLLAHLSPSQDAQYKYIHGWISRKKSADGKWSLIMKPRVQAILVLGWKSPVDGVIDINAKVAPTKGEDGITLDIGKGKESIFKQVYDVDDGGEVNLSGVNVKKGEFIYFVADEAPGYDTSTLVFEKLQIKLTKLNQ